MLRCSGVQFARDGFELGPIDALAKSGTITAVVGPNASGKTTLLEVVAGVRKPLQGTVEVDELNMHTCSSDHRAAVMAMMPQRPPVECPLSVGRLVSLGRLRLGRESAASEQAMGALGLESLRDRAVCSLSVGQAQDHLKRTLAATRWERVRGWHVLRHSFASNCAAKGVDQRLINAWMGHQTEEMMKRYQHLLPDTQHASNQRPS